MMRAFVRFREFAKDLLAPYPAIYSRARQIHRWLYQRAVLLYRWIKTPIVRPWYVRRYRAYWERQGARMVERESVCDDPAGWRGEEKMLIVDQVAELAPARVLEFGCGYGRILKSLWEKPLEAFICGCDLSLTNLANCKAYLSNPTIPLLQADGRMGLPFKDRSFDVVVTCGVLTHIPPPSDIAVRQELLRVTSEYIIHCESTVSGPYQFGHDNKAVYSTMGYAVEEIPFPVDQGFSNPRQFILVHAGERKNGNPKG